MEIGCDSGGSFTLMTQHHWCITKFAYHNTPFRASCSGSSAVDGSAPVDPPHLRRASSARVDFCSSPAEWPARAPAASSTRCPVRSPRSTARRAAKRDRRAFRRSSSSSSTPPPRSRPAWPGTCHERVDRRRSHAASPPRSPRCPLLRNENWWSNGSDGRIWLADRKQINRQR